MENVRGKRKASHEGDAFDGLSEILKEGAERPVPPATSIERNGSSLNGRGHIHENEQCVVSEPGSEETGG